MESIYIGITIDHRHGSLKGVDLKVLKKRK